MRRLAQGFFPLIVLAASVVAGCRRQPLDLVDARRIADHFALSRGNHIADYHVNATCYYNDEVIVFYEANIPEAGNHFSVHIDLRTHACELVPGR